MSLSLTPHIPCSFIVVAPGTKPYPLTLFHSEIDLIALSHICSRSKVSYIYLITKMMEDVVGIEVKCGRSALTPKSHGQRYS